MADQGISGQNFLRLLFGGVNGRGGAQAGVDQIPRQQAQQADLTLALQRMMQQQGQFDESLAQRQTNADRAFKQRETEFEFQRKEAGADRMRESALDFQNSQQLMIRNNQDRLKFKESQKRNKAEIENLRSLAANRESDLSMGQANAIAKEYNAMVRRYESDLQRVQAQGMTGEEAGLVEPGTFNEFAQERLGQIDLITGKKPTAEPDNIQEPNELSLPVLKKMEQISLGSKESFNANEAMRLLATPEAFEGETGAETELEGNELALARAQELLDEGFIDKGTYTVLLAKMGLLPPKTKSVDLGVASRVK